MIRGALECACTFSIFLFLSSCSATRPGSDNFKNDIFPGTLKVQREFGNFSDARSVSIDAFENIYILDAGAPGVYKFSNNGDSLRSVLGFGSGHNQFDSPSDIDATLTNSVAIADRNNNRIEIYSKDLTWQTSIRGHEPGSKIQFGYPEVVRAAPAGNMYIIDGENKRALNIQPERGAQQVITSSGTESGIEMNPVAMTISGNESVMIADTHSGSLISFNNAYLPQSRFRLGDMNETVLCSSDNEVYSFNKNTNIIRVFNAKDLTYKFSYALPSNVNKANAIFVYKDRYYILTKNKLVICSKEQ